MVAESHYGLHPSVMFHQKNIPKCIPLQMSWGKLSRETLAHLTTLKHNCRLYLLEFKGLVGAGWATTSRQSDFS